MPVHRVHKSVDVPEHIRVLERRGEAVLRVRNDGDYVEIVTAEKPVETRDGAA